LSRCESRSGPQREIRERDETIGDKERRIYDLKKKNQELEKFKFVLDYKIKDLKKQIEPKNAEILDMKEQIKKTDGELTSYQKKNAERDLVISNMRLKQSALAQEVRRRLQREGEGHTLCGRRRPTAPARLPAQPPCAPAHAQAPSPGRCSASRAVSCVPLGAVQVLDQRRSKQDASAMLRRFQADLQVRLGAPRAWRGWMPAWACGIQPPCTPRVHAWASAGTWDAVSGGLQAGLCRAPDPHPAP
jgi:hypothetical protein